MKKFEFTGKWNFEIELPFLSLFDLKSHLPQPHTPFKEVNIHNPWDSLSYPTDAQLAAVDIILNREFDIFKAIIKAFHEVIIPLWEEADVILPNTKTDEAVLHFLRLDKIIVLPTSIKGLSITEYYLHYDLEIGTQLLITFLGNKFICEGYDLPFAEEEYDKREWKSPYNL